MSQRLTWSRGILNAEWKDLWREELAIVVAVESDSATRGVVVTAIDIRRMK